MFDWLYEALGTMLSWFSSAMGGYYALALLLYALLFKIVFLPFSIKQQKNQIKMAKLTPKIELIKAKYKGRTDAATMQKQQEEIMALQKSEGYSMMSGCLPLLLQFPIIILLYNVIRNPLSYICQLSGEAIGQIKEIITLAGDKIPETVDQIGLISLIEKHGIDVSTYGAVRELPDFSLFGLDVNLAETPSLTSISVLVIIPVLAAALQWLTMFLTRKLNGNANQLAASDAQAGCSNKMMDIVMPLMTLWITFSFSAMMGVYWIYQSLFAILQAFILSKVMPMPKYSEEEIKAIRKAQKDQEKAQRAALKGQPKYRSLHYIDEDDYDELPTVKKSGEPTKNNVDLNGQDKPQIKD